MNSEGGFALSAPRVLAVHAESGPDDTNESISWFVTMSHEDRNDSYRVVIATLHGSWKAAQAEVILGMQVTWLGAPNNMTEEQVLANVAKSTALESAYDIARASLVTLLATVSLTAISVPTKSPVPEMSFHDEDDED